MKRLLASLALLAVAFSGCMSSSDACDDLAAAEPDATVVTMLPSSEYGPDEVTVSLGDDGEATVIWCNEGGSHNVHEENGLFQSDITSAKGEHFRHTFTEEGTYDYWCDPHKSQGMTGIVRVTA